MYRRGLDLKMTPWVRIHYTLTTYSTVLIHKAFLMLGRRRGPKHSFDDPLKRPHPLTEAAASTAATTVMTLVGSDMVASKHGFAVTCNGKRSPSSCERGSKGRDRKRVRAFVTGSLSRAGLPE